MKVAHREPIKTQHKQVVVTSSSSNQRYSAASASDFSLTPPPLPMRTHRPQPSASLYSSNNNNHLPRNTSSSSSELRDKNASSHGNTTLLSHIKVQVTPDSPTDSYSPCHNEDDFFEMLNRGVLVKSQSAPALPPRVRDVKQKTLGVERANNTNKPTALGNLPQDTRSDNHRDAHARRMQLLRNIRREHGLNIENEKSLPGPQLMTTSGRPQYKVAPIDKSYPQEQASACLVEEEDIYFTIDDENTQTYTSLSYTLPEMFDTEDELPGDQGPWYHSSESYSEVRETKILF